MYRVGTDLEALELLTSIVDHCVLSILIAKLSQHQSESKNERATQFCEGLFKLSAGRHDWGRSCFVFKQNFLFSVALTGFEPVTSPMCTARSNPLQGASRPTELQDLILRYLQCVHSVQYLHRVIVEFIT